MTRVRVAAVVAAGAVLAGACGVRPERVPHRLTGVVVATPTGTSDTVLARPTAISVYLVHGESVVAVQRVADGPATVERRIALLAQGPSDREAAAGLRTALAGGLLAPGASVRGASAVVSLASSFLDAGTEEQILALAQIVFTVTDTAGLFEVAFRVDGAPVSVPRADGSLTAAGVSRADYASLVAP